MAETPVSNLDAAVGLTAESLSPGRLAFRRFLTHRAAVVSVGFLVLLILWVLLSPWTARYGVNEQVFDISQGPNQNLPPASFAWFGTDIIGRLFDNDLGQAAHMGDQLDDEIIPPFGAIHVLQMSLHMTHLTVKPVQLESQPLLHSGCQFTVKHPS